MLVVATAARLPTENDVTNDGCVERNAIIVASTVCTGDTCNVGDMAIPRLPDAVPTTCVVGEMLLCTTAVTDGLPHGCVKRNVLRIPPPEDIPAVRCTAMLVVNTAARLPTENDITNDGCVERNAIVVASTVPTGDTCNVGDMAIPRLPDTVPATCVVGEMLLCTAAVADGLPHGCVKRNVLGIPPPKDIVAVG